MHRPTLHLLDPAEDWDWEGLEEFAGAAPAEENAGALIIVIFVDGGTDAAGGQQDGRHPGIGAAGASAHVAGAPSPSGPIIRLEASPAQPNVPGAANEPRPSPRRNTDKNDFGREIDGQKGSTAAQNAAADRLVHEAMTRFAREQDQRIAAARQRMDAIVLEFEFARNPHKKLSDLADILPLIAKSGAGKEEARRIAEAFANTWSNNWTLRWVNPFRGQTRWGYWCYEWAWAFKDAANLESRKEMFFIVTVHMCWTDDFGATHAWIEVYSVETGQTIYIDDGFTGRRSFIHTSPPQCYPGGPAQTHDDPATRGKLPPPYDSSNTKRPSTLKREPPPPAPSPPKWRAQGPHRAWLE